MYTAKSTLALALLLLAGIAAAAATDLSATTVTRRLMAAYDAARDLAAQAPAAPANPAPAKEGAVVQDAPHGVEDCTSANPNPTPGQPVTGSWVDETRPNSGWFFAYYLDPYEPNPARRMQMQVVWHTFYPRVGGTPTWLISDPAPVTLRANGQLFWTSPLKQTALGVPGGTQVGTLSMTFPSDSATRGFVQWTWNNQDHVYSASQCLYAYAHDSPAPEDLGPSMSWQPSQQTESTTDAPQGPYYEGVWIDPSVPGYQVETDEIISTQLSRCQGGPNVPPDCFSVPPYEPGDNPTWNARGYTQFHALSIYDTAGRPAWLTAQMGPYPNWPVPYWLAGGSYPTAVELHQVTANYAVTDPCSGPGCTTHTVLTVPQGNLFGRQYHSRYTGVIGLKVASSNFQWPPPGFAAPPTDIPLTGCPLGSTVCRPVKKRTDQYQLDVVPIVCDVTTPNGTCAVTVTWNAALMVRVLRIDADTGQLRPHGNDLGVVSASPWGTVQDFLAADERVLYRMMIGDRQIIDRSARGAASRISVTPTTCVVPIGGSSCPVTVDWSTPDPDDATSRIYVYRSIGLNGNPPVEEATPWSSRDSVGSKVDTVTLNERVFYTVKRVNGATATWLASTSANPTTARMASVSVSRTSCSVPLNQTTCPIAVTWDAAAPNARLFRLTVGHDGACPAGDPDCVPLTIGASGTYTDALPLNKNVYYIVKIGSDQVAQSPAVGAFASTLAIDGGVTSCIVPEGQNTCSITLRWTSQPDALVFRINETGSTTAQIGGGSNSSAIDPLPPGARVHYELKIDGVLHAITAAVTTLTDSEGGDSTTGAPAAPPPPTTFTEPTLDADSDKVGAIAGEFRVDESGNAVYRIPLAAAPGAGGLTPKLALTYSSGGGDGVVGTGFTLEGLSAITPCRPSVEAGDADAPSADPSQFCLDGQRLLLVSGQHRQLKAQYRTEIDTFQQIELSAIETANVAGVSNPAFVFTVKGKDGSVRRFGGASATVFGRFGAGGFSTGGTGTNSAPGLAFRPQGWLQNQLKDAAGNTIAFQYTGAAGTGESLLQNVTYPGGSMVFAYDASPRTDVAYSAIGRRQQSQLLKSIDVRDATGGALRYYEPAYNTAGWGRLRPHVTSLKECNRQGGSCYPATTFAWSEASTQTTVFTGSMRKGLGYYQFGDFNGDKRADVWWTSGPPGDETDVDNNWLHVSTFTADANGTLTLRELYSNDRLLPDGYLNGGLWEVFDSNGDGRDDLVFAYNNNNQMQWIRRLSTGTGLGDEQVLFSVPFTHSDCRPDASSPTGTCEQLGSSLFADVNGDGLPDLVFRAPDGVFWVALNQLTGVAGDPYRFVPYRASFVDGAGSPIAGDHCSVGTSSLLRKEENYSQAVDFDGDGRADLRFLIDARDCPNDDNFRMDVFLSKGLQVSGQAGQAFVFQAATPFGNDVRVFARGIAEAGLELRTLDINGDGLTDLVYRGQNNLWYYRLGGPEGTVNACAAECTLRSDRAPMQLLDFDGDGKLDFWEKAGSGDAGNYQVHLWTGENWSTEAVATTYWSPQDSWSRTSADLDGDGSPDDFYVQRNSGQWTLHRSNNHHKPRGAITQIVNGLGAKTDIDYAPLTYSTVYRRDYDAPRIAAGRGSPVFDVAAPSYVARRAASSAPTVGTPGDAAEVRYRYAGLKVQGGGRGSLGFRRVSTADWQTGIEVDSYYLQEFPYTGLAEFTQTREPGAAKPGDACYAGTGGAATPDAPACMRYVPPCSTAGCEDDDLPGIADRSSVIKESADQYQWRKSAVIGVGGSAGGSAGNSSGGGKALVTGTGPIFVARTESLTTNYDLVRGLPGGAIGTESLAFPFADYDDYGNPRSSTTIKAGGGTTVTQAATFAYDNDPTRWQLGRLRSTTVTTTRVQDGVTTSVGRQSSFTYDANGMLASEKVEGLQSSDGSTTSGSTGTTAVTVDASAPAVAKYYAYDGYGNRSATFVCSTTIAEATCRAQTAAGGGGYQFHQAADAARVMRYSRTSYAASQGRFADSVTEVFSAGGSAAREAVASQVTARNAAGDPTELVDANNVPGKIRYGALGRKRVTWAPTVGYTSWTARYCAGAYAPPGASTAPCPANMGLAYTAVTTTSGAPTGRVFYDVLGRPTVTVTQGFGAAEWIATIQQYDERGNVKRQSDPFFARDDGANAITPVAGAAVVWTETTYDALNRPTLRLNTTTTAATTIAYDGLRTVTTLPANGSGFAQAATEIRNGLGEVVRTIDAVGTEVTTRYDAGGSPVEIRHAGVVTSMSYDTLGRKTGLSDRDAGNWVYAVNGLGETIRQYSPRNTCTTSDYDGRGRVWRRRDHPNRSCTSPESESTWTYDTASYGTGALAQETNAEITRTSGYDSLGRRIRVETSLDGKTYVEQTTYDPYGRTFQRFFTTPGLPTTGEQNAYTATGYLESTGSAYATATGATPLYRRVQTMNARGQVEKEQSAPASEYTQRRFYDPATGRLTRLLAQSETGGLLQDANYGYDLVGNLTTRIGADRQGIPAERFGYDALQRLVSSSVTLGSTTAYARSQSYYPDGNLNYKNDAGSYTYGTKPTGPGGIGCNASNEVTPGPHAVSSAGATWRCYDANGNVVRQLDNQTGRRVLGIVYNAADQAVDLTHDGNNARVGFRYGPGRERVRRLDYPNAAAQTANTIVHFVGDAEVRYTATAGNGGGVLKEVRRYAGNVLVVQTGSGGSYRIKRQVLLADLQGSTHQVLGATTMRPVNAATPASFDAWGKRRNGEDWSAAVPWTASLELLLQASTTHGYTGHEMAEAVGVIHMNGRLYDAHFARFLQADPLVQSPHDAQSWNRYSYAFNNPMRYTDPSGFMSTGDWIRTIVAVAITVYSGGTAAGAAWGLFGGASLTTAQSLAVVAVGGFAAGAVQTGTLRGAVTGAVSSGVFYGVGTAFSQANAGWAYNADGSMSMSGYAAKSLTHGVVGGVMAELQGGRFGHGFASAGLGEALSPAPASGDGPGMIATKTVAAAVVGGTASRLGGGKFANGAVTAAFGYAFNQVAHSDIANPKVDVTNLERTAPWDEALNDLARNDVEATNGAAEMLKMALEANGDPALIELFNKTSFNYVPGYTDPQNPFTGATAGIDKYRPGHFVIRFNSGFSEFTKVREYPTTVYNFRIYRGGPTLGLFLVAHEFGHIAGFWNNEAGASNFAAKLSQSYPGKLEPRAYVCMNDCN